MKGRSIEVDLTNISKKNLSTLDEMNTITGTNATINSQILVLKGE